MSFVFQDPTLLPWRDVYHNIALPLELAGEDREGRDARIGQAIELVGLADFARSYPAELSGGMRMRVSLARALVTDPALLLLDEPFAALDDITRQTLNEELLSLWETRHWTGIFVTHNIAEAIFLSQRVLVLSRRPGRVLADVAVPFAFPRASGLRADADFARLTGEVAALLREASR
jgi:NitT/TauT family transport system ATP-binding protein